MRNMHGLVHEKFVKFLREHSRLKMVPPSLIGYVLMVFPQISGDEYSKWAGIQTVDFLMNFLVSILLMTSTLVYFYLFFKKEWKGYWHWKIHYRYFHWGSFAFLGLAAVMIPYYGGVSTFFFGLVDHEFGNGEILEYLPYLTAYYGVFSFLATDMFNGFTGKAYWFRIPEINRGPMKHYSHFDHLVCKYILCKINKKKELQTIIGIQI